MDSQSVSSSVVPIFATPFAVVHLPEAEKLNRVVAGLLVGRATADGASAAQGSNALCYTSRDDLLDWTDEPLRQVTGEIVRGIWSFVAAVNEFTDVQLKSFSMQARGWFTIVRPDGCLPARSYPMSSWCAIYCVEAPEPSPERQDSGVLRLYESRLGTMFTDATNCETRMPFRPGHCAWSPIPGRMAVFPASISHEVALIRSRGLLMLLTVRARFVAPGQEGVSAW